LSLFNSSPFDREMNASLSGLAPAVNTIGVALCGQGTGVATTYGKKMIDWRQRAIPFTAISILQVGIITGFKGIMLEMQARAQKSITACCQSTVDETAIGVILVSIITGFVAPFTRL